MTPDLTRRLDWQPLTGVRCAHSAVRPALVRFARMASGSGGRGRSASDEFYVLDLCDEVLGQAGLRQYRFQ